MSSAWAISAASTVRSHATISARRVVRRTTCASRIGGIRPRLAASFRLRSSMEPPLRDEGGLGGLLDHPVLDHPDLLDLDPYDVTRNEELPRRGADAGGRPGRDDVARLEREGGGQRRHLIETVEDELARVRMLAQL